LLTENDVDTPPQWQSGAAGFPRVVKLRIPRGAQLFGGQRVSPELLEIMRTADVLHLHCLWDLNLRCLIRLARAHHVPYVLSLHGLLNDWAIRYKFPRKYIYWKLVGRWILAHAGEVHCTSEGERRQALKWLPRDNIRVVPLGMDKAGFLQLPGKELIQRRFPHLATAEPKVLMLGRLHPVKRIELLIEAIAQLRRTGVPAQLIVAGPCEMASYLAKLRQQIEQLSLQTSVHFVGTVDGAEKASLYEACDVFVLPSWQENFGMVLAEALAAGTPIVTTRAVDTWSEFEAGGGIIVEPTPAAVAEGCRPLLESSSLRAELGRRGREFVLDWLDPDKVLETYVALYRDAMGHYVEK
jgi:glycosyltransferase involved in cell wall biosynthesis